MSPDESWPRRRWAFRWACSQLRLAGADGVARQAYYLFPEEPAGPRAALLGDDERMLPGAWNRYARQVVRRCAGEPLQYVKGRAHFYSLSFCVSPSVLIPRPETEVLVDAVLSRQLIDGPILDIGTGCGAVAVVLARRMPKRRLVAVDISPRALQVARENARRLNVPRRIEFLCGDLFSPVSGRRFAAVISNPPYVASEELPDLPRHIRDFEPETALNGGPGGMQIIARIIAGASEHLLAGGLLVLEVGCGQARPAAALCGEYFGPDAPIEFCEDLSDIKRVIICERR